MHQARHTTPRHAESEDLSLVEMAGTDNGSDSSHGNANNKHQQKQTTARPTTSRRPPLFNSPNRGRLSTPSSSPRLRHAHRRETPSPSHATRPVDTPSPDAASPSSDVAKPPTDVATPPNVDPGSPDRELLLRCSPFDDHAPPVGLTGQTISPSPLFRPGKEQLPTRRHTQHHVTIAPGTSGRDNGGSAASSASDVDAKQVSKRPLNSRMSFSRRFSRKDSAFINRVHLNMSDSQAITARQLKKSRKSEIQQIFGKNGKKYDKHETSTTTSSQKDSCRCTLVFDPAGQLSYWWSAVVSVAFIYNFWVLIYRFAFDEININNMAVWFMFDYLADLLYICDIAFKFRTGFLENGVLQTDSIKLRIHYMNSMTFYVDCLCLLPLDFLYLSIGFRSIFRGFRLVKIYRFWAFLDRTERHTNYPNLVRTITLLHYLLAIYHWNSCLIYSIVKSGHTRWKYPEEMGDTVTSNYLHSLYLSTLTLTTIGELPVPSTRTEYVFVIVEFVLALLLFSAVLGHVANIVTSIGAARKEFQAQLDSVKTYMILRGVPFHIQNRVIRWFDYLWQSKNALHEQKALSLLPTKLKAEIALHVHLDTLKRVEIFQNTEAGFLCELVLHLKPILFSPGDYICRKGEVGKEMYIVSKGRLKVVTDNGRTTLALLTAGSYFGEISILNMGNAGNRRTASVRSIGYSDLFCLSKESMWEVLKDYPTARVRLESIAIQRLQRFKKAPIEKAALSRSKSTPGLLETEGRTTIQTCIVNHRIVKPQGILRNPPGAGLMAPPKSITRSHEIVDLTDADETKECLLGSDENIGSEHSENADDLPKGLSIDTRGEGAAGDVCANIGCRIQLMTPNGDCCPGAVPYYPACFAIPTAPGTTGSPHLLLATPATPAMSPGGVMDHAHLATTNEATPTADHKLVAELKRLRERLKAIESENAHMSCKLREQQSDVNHRLEDLEHQIGSSHSPDSDTASESPFAPRCRVDLSNFTGPSVNMESMI